MNNSNSQEFQATRARQNLIVGAGLIILCVTLLSCVSSYMIYREGFADAPWFAQQALSLIAVVVVEGAFVWLVYGFTKAFSSFGERMGSMVGIGFLLCVMTTNIITHFMMVKKLPLTGYQHAWLSWGAVSVFIATLLIVLYITLSNSTAKRERQSLRLEGKRLDMMYDVREQALKDDDVMEHLLENARQEARQLVSGILGANNKARIQQPTFQAPLRSRKALPTEDEGK